VTLEPCAMCAGAIVLARIPKLVFGAFDPKAGACGTLYNIVQDQRLNHRVELVSRVLEAKCSGMLKDFFAKVRTNEIDKPNGT
ncbi:MAG: nucleoside deaminase, partial [Ignavibacteriae bacterium]|nr:nucleoside deaminase [Ignavibacteriota bacterium]